MGQLERRRDFLNLTRRLGRTEVDRGADRDRAHVPRLLDLREHDLVVAVRIRDELVVIQLHHERNLVRVLARADAERAERRGDAVAPAFDGELDDVFGVEILRRGREAGAGGVLDALVDRKNRDVAGAGEAAGVQDRLEVAQHLRRTVGIGQHAGHEIGPGEVQLVFREALRLDSSAAASASAPSKLVGLRARHCTHDDFSSFLNSAVGPIPQRASRFNPASVSQTARAAR